MKYQKDTFIYKHYLEMDKQKENKRAKMESEFDMKDIIVIDNGADTVKIGISGEDRPRVN